MHAGVPRCVSGGAFRHRTPDRGRPPGEPPRRPPSAARVCETVPMRSGPPSVPSAPAGRRSVIAVRLAGLSGRAAAGLLGAGLLGAGLLAAGLLAGCGGGEPDSGDPGPGSGARAPGDAGAAGPAATDRAVPSSGAASAGGEPLVPGAASAPGAAPGADPTADPAAAARDAAAAAWRRSILDERVGLGRVGDLGLSDDLVARAADRALQEQFQDRFHSVYVDRERDPEPGQGEPGLPERAVAFTLEPHFVPDAVMSERETARTARPANRGFRAPRTVAAPGERPAPRSGAVASMDVRAGGADLEAASLVARRLARDGLAATAVRAAAILRPELASAPASARPALAAERLAAVGLPVDLLAFAGPLRPGSPPPGLPAPPPAPDAPASSGGADDAPDDAPDDDAAREDRIRAWLAAVLAELEAGADPDALAASAAAAPVRIRPTIPGFRAARDDGAEPLGLVRLQPTRGTYWAGRGGGGSLDLAVAILEALPDVAMTVSVGTPHVGGALRRMGPAREGARGAVTVIDEPHVIQQWAQDNGQPGRVDGDARPWLLAPRYASRGDFGSILDPGETWMVEGLPPAGIGVARSPLLFQGGNLLVVGDPGGDGRLLLAGDAEIDRNVALGLRRDEIRAAMRTEFGVDRVVVLRPPAFHLDFATTIRRVPVDPARRGGPTRAVAFVHDEDAGFDLMLEIGLDRLVRAGALEAAVAAEARSALAAGDRRRVIDLVGPPLYARQRADGMWPLTLADAFGDAPGREGVAVLDRFLCAFERLMGLELEPRQVPGPPEVQVYLATYPRREADLAAFDRELEDLGFELVRLPGFALQRRSVNAVNMVHGRDRILRPVSGGTLAPLDEAARAVLEATVGRSARIIDLPTAETQRRSGAVGCAVAAWPRTATAAPGPLLP